MVSEKQTAKNIVELINPKKLPEAGFQSYKELTDNGAAAQKEPFLNGEMRNPHFTHPNFQGLSHLDRGIVQLGAAREQAGWMVEEGPLRVAFHSSLEFRQAEMEYVKLLAQLEFLAHERPDDAEAIREVAD